MVNDELRDFLAEWQSPEPTLLVHTSGSTGEPKPLRVEKRRMVASAEATLKALNLKPGATALLCMPLKYIAGKMMVVRSIVGGLHLICIESSGHPLAKDLGQTIDFAAMVPLQVFNSIEKPQEQERLKAIRNIIIGGGSIDEEMERKLKDFPNAVWSTYGMTETLSHIALRRVNGSEASEWYTPLDGVSVAVAEDGSLIVNAPNVCQAPLHTHDCACLHPDGRRFRILGRMDNVIDSGGIKLHIENIERKLRPDLPPFLITKVPDNKFGEAVVLMMEQGNSETSPNMSEKDLSDLFDRKLEKYERPRYIARVAHIPLTETGKPARKKAEEMALSLLCRN